MVKIAELLLKIHKMKELRVPKEVGRVKNMQSGI